MSTWYLDLDRYHDQLLILLRHRAGGAVPLEDVRAAALAALRHSAAIIEALAVELPGIVRDLGGAGPDDVVDRGVAWEPAVFTLTACEPLTASQRDALAMLVVVVGELELTTLNPAVSTAYRIAVEAFQSGTTAN